MISNKKTYIESTNIFLGSLDYFSYGADTANTFGDRYATIQTHVWRSYVSYVLMFTLFKFLSQAHTMKLQVWYLPGWGISCRSCDTINGAFDNSGRRRGEFFAAADTFLADIYFLRLLSRQHLSFFVRIDPVIWTKVDCVCMMCRFQLLVQVFRTKSNMFDDLHAYSADLEKHLKYSLDQMIRDNSNSTRNTYMR